MTTTTKSSVPSNCLGGVPVCAGIDEAGRGPVMGAMLYGIAYWPIAENEAISAMKFDDSKVLSEKQRENLFTNLKESGKIGWAVMSISPEAISAQMLRRMPYNLNAISHDAAIALVRLVLGDGVNVQQVFVDTVGDSERYQEKLNRVFEVTRDVELAEWRFREPGFTPKGELGSGYPGDAVTKEWLRANMDKLFGFPSLVRFSWSTCRDLLKSDGVAVKWEEDEDEAMLGQPKLTFAAASAGPRRCDFVRKLGLHAVVDDF